MAWSGKGSWEPSTRQDRDDGFMWLTGDTSPAGRKVYFNGFITDGEALITSTSPNSGILKTAIQPRNALPFAMLGVWKDCNRDDFIGNSDANYVYPAALPGVDVTLCPPTPGVYPTHNDGRWIYEFTPITYNNASVLACCDVNTYVDNEAKVWADTGLPDAITVPTCLTSPWPENTMQSTGGIIGWLDCQDDYAITRAVNALADATGQDQLSFSDQPPGNNGESDSLLNQRFDALGEPGDDSYVYAFDCSDPENPYNVQDDNPTPFHENPTGIEREQVPGVVTFNVTAIWNTATDITFNPNVNAPTVNTGGSLWGTANETDTGSSDCDNSNGSLGDTDHIGEAAARRDFTGRVRPDATLTSAQWPHKYMGVNTQDPVTDISDKQNSLVGADFRQFWHTGNTVENTGPLTRDGRFAEGQYWTYYARLSTSAISAFSLQVPGVTGTYGSEACAASALDGKTRFDCARANWWLRADGSVITPQDAGNAACASKCDPRAFVGDVYNLRDIDCYDYSVGVLRDQGFTTAHVAGRPC